MYYLTATTDVAHTPEPSPAYTSTVPGATPVIVACSLLIPPGRMEMTDRHSGSVSTSFRQPKNAPVPSVTGITLPCLSRNVTVTMPCCPTARVNCVGETATLGSSAGVPAPLPLPLFEPRASEAL